MDSPSLSDVAQPKCRYGSKCYRSSPGHLQKYSHPPKLEDNEENGLDIVVTTKLSISQGKITNKTTRVSHPPRNIDKQPDAVVRLPPDISVVAVMGKNFGNVGIIAKQTGVRSVMVGSPGNQKLNLFGPLSQVASAVNCWDRLIAVAPRQRKIEKVYPQTNSLVAFFPPPEGIRLLQQYKDPQILRLVDSQVTDVETAELKTTVSKQLEALTSYAGHIKLIAKFGKNIWYLVPDSLLGNRPANEIFKAISDLPVKSFFSMGIDDENLLRGILEFRKEKESFNFKVLIQHGGLYESVLISVLVKGGILRFAKAHMHEEKHITDQICLDKDVDIRVSLENTKLLSPVSPLYTSVLQFAQSLQLKKDINGENTVVLPVVPNIQVYRMQHKKRSSFIFEDVYNIDIIHVRIFESEDKLLVTDYKPPAEILFEPTPTEVEVSSQKWKRMFKFNKPDHSLHTPWTAQEIMAGFPQFVKVVHDVASLLHNAGKKNSE